MQPLPPAPANPGPSSAPAPVAAAASRSPSPPAAEALLADGLRAYEDGRYPVAQRQLRDALEEGLRNRADRVTAHKHLAFIYCATRQEVLCRDAFRRALEIDPKFQLTPAEAGHPLWGPVFKSLKAKGTA
jgi:Tfp pilus assembly protein PilF